MNNKSKIQEELLEEINQLKLLLNEINVKEDLEEETIAKIENKFCDIIICLSESNHIIEILLYKGS